MVRKHHDRESAKPSSRDQVGCLPDGLGSAPSRRPAGPVVPLCPVVRRSPSRRGGCASSRLDHGLKVELDPYIKGPKRQLFPSFVCDFFAGFRAVYLNFPSFFAGPGPGPGGGPGPGQGPGPAKEDGKCFFFQHGFFKPYGPKKAKRCKPGSALLFVFFCCMSHVV